MCSNPVWISNKSACYGNGHNVGRYVPCGHCVECLRKRQNEWYVRFYLESKYWKKVLPSSQTLFITLTYENKNLPKNRTDAFNDVRALFKKVERKWNISRLRYYLVSENGTLNGRLHFHLLLFGIDVFKFILPIDKEFKKLWSKGFSKCEVASPKTFTYVSKYVTKDLDTFKSSSSWPPICSCSKRPPLGVLFFTDTHRVYFDSHDDDLFIPINGYRYSIPRYLRQCLLSDAKLFLSSTHCGILHGATLQGREDDLIKRRTINNIYGFKKLKNKVKNEFLSDYGEK